MLAALAMLFNELALHPAAAPICQIKKPEPAKANPGIM